MNVDAFKEATESAISDKVLPNTITPDNVGGRINDLADLVAEAVNSEGFVPIAGNDLIVPGDKTSATTIVQKGTYTNVGGGADLEVTAPSALLFFNGTVWSIQQQYPVDLSGYTTQEDFDSAIIPLETAIAKVEVLPSPPAKLPDATVNTPGSYVLTNTWPDVVTTIGYCKVSNVPPYNASVKRFFVNLDGADVTRTVVFYVLREVVGGWLCMYKSGGYNLGADGVNYATPTENVDLNPGDYVFCRVTSAPGRQFRYRYTGGPATERSISFTSDIAVGQTILDANVTEGLQFRPSVGADVQQANNLVARTWIGAPNGVAGLQSDGALDPTILPAQLKGKENDLKAEVIVATDPEVNMRAVTRTSGGIYSFDCKPGYTSTRGTNPAFNKASIISCLSGKTGFASDGILTELRVAYNTTAFAGGKVQVFIVRPINKTTGSFSLVGKVGELNSYLANEWYIFRGLSMLVKADDMIMVRGINWQADFHIGATSAPYAYYFVPTVADESMNAWNNGVPSSTFASGIAFRFEADINTNGVGARDVPGAPAVTDSNNDLSNVVMRKADNGLRGKTILWLGTSIPAGTSAGFPAYPVLVGDMLQAKVINNSVGSSMAFFNGANNLGLSGKITELNAITPGYGAFSHETLIGGLGVGVTPDLIVFDHMHNDHTIISAGASGIGRNPLTLLTGTVTASLANVNLVGVGTAFTTELTVGDIIHDVFGRQVGRVATITNNTTATLTGNGAYAIANSLAYSTSLKRSTFKGAISYLVDYARTLFPNVSFAFVTCPSRYSAIGALPATFDAGADAVLALAKAYDAPAIDLMRNANYNWWNNASKTVDGVHQTPAERAPLAQICYQELRKIRIA